MFNHTRRGWNSPNLLTCLLSLCPSKEYLCIFSHFDGVGGFVKWCVSHEKDKDNTTMYFSWHQFNIHNSETHFGQRCCFRHNIQTHYICCTPHSNCEKYVWKQEQCFGVPVLWCVFYKTKDTTQIMSNWKIHHICIYRMHKMPKNCTNTVQYCKLKSRNSWRNLWLSVIVLFHIFSLWYLF